jgi:hypothetical protein
MSEEIQNTETIEINEPAFQNEKPTRPTFVLVLCILSWVYVGFGLLGVMGNMGASKVEANKAIDEQIYQMKASEIASTDFGKDTIAYMESTKAIPGWNNTTTAILLLLEGFAVFLIFQMKRNGFWIYLAAQIGFLVQTYSVLPFPNMMSMAALIMSFLIIVVFTILYAVNLKHLRN